MSAKIDLNDPANLSNLLALLVTNDTTTIRSAEKALKPFMKQSTSTLAFLNQVQNSQNPIVRHQAALLMKKKMMTNFPKLGTHQALVKTQILVCLRNETVKAVNIALAGCVSTLAKSLFSIGGEWPELFMLLMEFSQSSNEMLRYINYSLLEQLAEHVSENLISHTGTLTQMFVAGCQDANPDVAVAAMKATSTYINAIRMDPAVMQLKPVLTPILTVLQGCLQRGEDENVVEGFDVMQLCVMMEQPLINDHIEALVQFSVTILQAEGCDSSVKQAAGQMLMNTMEGRPKMVAKKQLVVPTLSALASIIAKADSSKAGLLFSESDRALDREEADEDDEDEEEMDLCRLAQAIIDVMAIHIPSKYFVDPALTLCAQGMQSPDPQMRKAGCALLGIIAEGCKDAIRQILPSIMPPLIAAVQDKEFFVREVACFALGQFSEHCQPEILHYHQVVFPAIFPCLDDTRSTVQGTSCYVLEMFCENLQKETLRPFLEPLLSRLAALLQGATKMLTKEMAMSAIAATAVAAEIEFLPYAETICTILGQSLFVTEPAQFPVRGRSLECLGHVAVAIGADNFTRYFETGLNSAMQALTLNNDDLKEHSYVFFANSSKVMGRRFDPFLPTIMGHLQEVIEGTELVFGGESDEEGEEGEADGEDDDEEDDDDVRINGQDGFVNTKKAALTAVGSIAEHTKEAFYPYLATVMNSMMADQQGSLYSFHEVIRGESVLILQFFVECGCATHNLIPAKKGESLTLPPPVFELVRSCLQACLKILSEDEEKLPVSLACESLCGILTQIGLVALSIPVNDKGELFGTLMIQQVHLLLQEKAPCQVAAKYEEDDEEAADDEDHDNLVMDALTDLIGVLARVLGEAFVPFFDMMLPVFMRFMKETRIHTDRSMAIGCFAEVIEEIGVSAIKYVDTVLPIIQKGLADPMEPVRRNSAFCLGVLVQSTGTALVPHFGPILQWLHPLCTRSTAQQAADTGGADIDNALSAVARMMKIAPEALPMPLVLPVLLAALPLRSDAVEGPNIYGRLIDLITASNPVAIDNFDKILIAFAQTLVPGSNALDEVKASVISCLKFLSTSRAHQSLFLAAMSSITDASFQKCLSDALQS